MGTSEPGRERLVLGQVLSLAWDLGYIIVVPLVVFALGGRLLDKHFGTSPLLLLAGIFISLALSTIGVYRLTKKITASLDVTDHKNNQPPSV